MSGDSRTKYEPSLRNDDEILPYSSDTLDTVCGEITLSIDHEMFASKENCENTYDTYDSDIRSHINSFLQTLPVQINLQQLKDLTLSDPQTALTVLNEIRLEVDTQLHKAQMLRQLYLQQM